MSDNRNNIIEQRPMFASKPVARVSIVGKETYLELAMRPPMPVRCSMEAWKESTNRGKQFDPWAVISKSSASALGVAPSCVI